MSQMTLSQLPETRRDRRIQRRRNEILAAAAQVFAEKGYANTTTKDIADAVDMGESTLYNYFEGKRQILLAILEQKRAEMDALLGNIDRVEGRESLVLFIDRSMEVVFSRISFTCIVLREAWGDPEVFQLMEKRLRRASALVEGYVRRHVESGEFRFLDPEIAAHMILGMLIGLILPVLRGHKPVPSPEQRHAYAEALAAFLLDGISLHHP